MCDIHAKNLFLNLGKLNHIWNEITLFRMLCYQKEFYCMPNQSEKCNYKPNLVQINNNVDSCIACMDDLETYIYFYASK